MKTLDYSCNSEMHQRCVNNALCHLCDGVRLFKDPVAERKAKEEAAAAKKKEKRQAILKTKDGPKEGMAFEQRVQKTWNQNVTAGRKPAPRPVAKPRLQPEVGEAKRHGNASGSLWFDKGDIKLEHALLECKERGTVNSKGEKQITIPKEWLDKSEKEAFQEGKEYWYLPFGYKGDEEIYLIKPFDHEMQLINELRLARSEIEKLQQQVKELGGNAT